ncbi:MAG TPA: hypothetical protein VGW35_02615 [Methylomirabilota bacterium]|jgi:hypothetical protein|nr:hypothetical protein [Methylomirabilota bacterium]
MTQFRIYALAAVGVVLLGVTTGTVSPLVQGRLAVAAIPPADPDAGQPFAASAAIGFASGETVKSASIAVPADKRIVIETITLGGATREGDMRLHFRTTAPNLSGGTLNTFHFLVLTFQGVFGNDRHFAATHAARFYANPGTSLEFTAFRSSGTGLGIMRVKIMGYRLNP